MSATHKGTAANDVDVEGRLQPIHASSRYLGKYRSAVQIRDIPTFHLDEPTELGGENMGPTPLENVLGSLCACTSMIVYILKREMNFQFDDMRCEADGVTDVRRVEMKRTGQKYTEVEPLAYHFHSVDMTIYIKTTEPEDRFEEMKRQVARLCPVSKLIEDSGAPFKVTWIRE